MIPVLRTFASGDSNAELTPVQNNLTTITFLRSSTQRVTPQVLASTILINPVSAMLNGSRVTCSEIVQGGLEGASSTTVIHVEDLDNKCKLVYYYHNIIEQLKCCS